jgi:hypothetical protein
MLRTSETVVVLIVDSRCRTAPIRTAALVTNSLIGGLIIPIHMKLGNHMA